MVARISKSNKATTMKSILTRLHLQQYLPTFQKHDIDITVFLTLNEQTLKIIGIKNESHRKILIIWIKKLQQLLLTSTNNNNDISTLSINTKKILSEINNDDKDYDEEGGGEEEEEEDDDDDDQIIIDEQLILETVQNNNKKLLTPITEEDSDGSSFFFNNNNNNNSDDDDDGDGGGGGGKSDVGIILNSATTQVTDYNTVPIPEYSEIDLINTQFNSDENRDDINEIIVNDNNTHYFYHNPQSNTSSSTLATSASITTLPSYTPFTTSTLLRTLSRNSSKSSKSSRLTKLSLSSRIFNGGGGPTIVESEDSNNNNDNNNNSNNNNNNNNMIVSDIINNKSKNKRKHQSVLNPKNWRHSMPLIPSISSLLPSSPLSSAQSSSPPSYFDIVVDDYNDKKSDHHIANSLVTNDKSKYNVDCDKEGNELLPEYSCTVNHSGFVLIKKEFTRKGIKATKRSWQKRYLYLWGTFLCIYPNEPENINVAKPLNRFSMHDAQVELAIDYPKRKYVLRMKFKTGHQYLIQADDKEECVSWIERLQSSCNISSTIDERQMPMFITLPTRRRNNGGNISSGVDVTNIIHNDGYDNYGTSLASTSLTYQRFNEIAREIQQVQITNSSINYQLSW